MCPIKWLVWCRALPSARGHESIARPSGRVRRAVRRPAGQSNQTCRPRPGRRLCMQPLMAVKYILHDHGVGSPSQMWYSCSRRFDLLACSACMRGTVIFFFSHQCCSASIQQPKNLKLYKILRHIESYGTCMELH